MSFQFNHHWLRLPDLAELSLSVNGKPLLLVEDCLNNDLRLSVRVPLLPVVGWFMDNWWRLRWEPFNDNHSWRMAHHLGAIGGGVAWPELSFNSDGQQLLIHLLPSAIERGATIKYLAQADEWIEATVFERELDRWIVGLLTSLSVDHPLHELWQQLQQERSDTELSQWRKLEALMGFDMDEAPNGLVEQLMGAMEEVGEEAVNEVAAASQHESMNHLLQLKSLEKAALSVNVVGFDSVNVKECMRMEDRAKPWLAGQRLAAQVRERWQLKATEPLVNIRLAEGVELPVQQLEDNYGSPRYNLPFAVGYGRRGEQQQRFLFSKQRSTGRRFELARWLGDILFQANSNDALWPLTSAKTIRQKFQRAFAQELLCPYAAIQTRLAEGDEDDALEQLAEDYQVSPLLVKTALVNRGEMDRETLVGVR